MVGRPRKPPVPATNYHHMSKTPSIVLGISYGHGDSSAALVKNGKILAAAEEERFIRLKHCAVFPAQAIQYCLRHGNITPEDVETIAIARKPYNAAFKKALLLLRYPRLLKKKPLSEKEPSLSLSDQLKTLGLHQAKIFRVEHHLAHLVSARYLSNKNELALLSFDGLGDFVSTAIAKATGNDIQILNRVYFPHSLGYFYTAMTQYLGFPHFGDEFKVMGLSSYGKPKYLPILKQFLRPNNGFGFKINLEAFPVVSEKILFSVENGQPKVARLFNEKLLTNALGFAPRKRFEPLTQVHKDLAKSIQVCFEQTANHLLHSLAEKVKTETLALAGGCSHNSVWVGQIPQKTSFRNIHVAPAAHDAGIAVGAAIAATKDKALPESRHWALLGPDLNELDENPKAKTFKLITDNKFAKEDHLINWMVEQLSQGKIMGVFRGRMEFGPRALGNRSILADPRYAEMKQRLNDRVKHRESFRPFAASVLWDYQHKWFQNSFYAPAMEAVFQVNKQLRSEIPGVVHADNTCRIQSIHRDNQPFFWKLLQAFRKKTGVPMLINTSFNDCEPIVCTQQQAYECFLNCDMDHLVLGMRTFSRPSRESDLSLPESAKLKYLPPEQTIK